MTPADLSLSTPVANPLPLGLATTPQNGSSCETFYFWRNRGKTSKKIMAGGRRYEKLGQNMTPEGRPGTHNLIRVRVCPLHALRTAARSIIRRTYLSRYKKSTVHRRLVFLNVVYSTKNLSIQDRAVHMKETSESFLLFFLFPLRER